LLKNRWLRARIYLPDHWYCWCYATGWALYLCMPQVNFLPKDIYLMRFCVQSTIIIVITQTPQTL